MKKLSIILSIICLSSCAVTDTVRYDSNSDRYKRQHGIHQSPPKTQAGPNSGKYYNR